MTQLFEMLFHYWCPAPAQNSCPSHLRDHPELAYAQYAFERGFKLGMELAVLSLDPAEMEDMSLS